ncbi:MULTISPECIES: hypothetical protein [unclassified Sphingobacterium]|nr:MULTISPECIES: hypothetical protein [unclassified Sphingobacterium]MDR6734289.1 hypothetical protein [Sphingobacterium sp. 2149]
MRKATARTVISTYRLPHTGDKNVYICQKVQANGDPEIPDDQRVYPMMF